MVSGPGDPQPSEFQFAGTDRFDVVSKLGAGGMGTVFKVFDRETQRHIALKALHAQRPEALLRFKNEFRALQGLRHPNLVELGELGEHEGVWFFTMELVEGVDFLSYVRARSDDAPAFHDRRLRQALAQVSRGLGALHAANKIHRDVKPSNIRITRAGRVVILDFGLVVDLTGRREQAASVVVGTAAYMAPEQAEPGGGVPASDFYAVGGLLYTALTGRTPFEGSDLDMLLRKQERMPQAPSTVVSGVPEDLDELCMDLLRTEPEERPSEAEVIARLGDIGEPTPARLRTAREPSALSSIGFVGRGHELDALVGHLEAPRRAHTVIVRGASGVGKSALLAQFCRVARRESPDVVVLEGRCYEKETVPFKGVDGVVDALTSYMRALPRDRAAALLPRNATLLAQVFPVLRRVEVIVESPRSRADVGDPQELRRRAFAALRELLTRLALRSPLIIAIDDMQWADADSRSLLAELMQGPEPPAMLLALAVRTGTDVDPSMFAGLPDAAEIIDLRALEPADAAQLASDLLSRAGVTATPADARALATEAGGHPLFLHELVRHVTTAGLDARRVAKLDDALNARFHQLSPLARRLLEVVVVAGVPISQDAAAFAAELDFGDYLQWVTELREANLVRTGGGRRADMVEPYHNRIREAALRGLTDEETAAYHRRMADALEATGEADASPELVLNHLIAAGQNARAAYHAEVAADRAADGLAFDRAAARYRMALRLGDFEGENRRRLVLALADALVSAGRGAEATELYLDLADSAGVAGRLEFHRRAAQQLLFSGHIDEGVEVVRSVLAELGDKLPASPRRALVSMLWQRLRQRVRGYRWKPRDESEVSPRDVARLDLYNAIGAGLSLVDNIRGADFQCRALRLALDLGEPMRIARALSIEGVFLASQHVTKRTQWIVQETRRLADESGDPATMAYAQFPVAALAYFVDNDWRAAREALDESERLLRAQVQAGGWETDTAAMYTCFCLMFEGELTELGEHVHRHVLDADRRGDLYASVNLRTRLTLLSLIRDDPRDAERIVDEAVHAWGADPENFQVQHFFELHSRCEIALYNREAAKAATFMARRARALKRSLLLRLPVVVAEVGYLRGRIALAQGMETEVAADRDTLVAEARSTAKRIRRVMPICHGLAELLLAGAATLEERWDVATEHLRAAVTHFEQTNTWLYAYPARYRLGQLVGGNRGAELMAASEAWFDEHQVANPEALVHMLMPMALTRD